MVRRDFVSFKNFQTSFLRIRRNSGIGKTNKFDIKKRKVFLRRIKVPYFNKKNLHVGGTVHIFGREMKVTDFGDKFTEERLKIQGESTFAMIKPDALQNLGTNLRSLTLRANNLDDRKQKLEYPQNENVDFIPIPSRRILPRT